MHPMESTVSATSTLLTISKTLNRHFSSTRSTQSLRSHLVSLQLRRLFATEFQRSRALNAFSSSSNSLRCLPRSDCVGSSAASFASSAGFGGGGGGGEIGGNGGGGGDGAADGGEGKPESVAVGSEEVSALSPDVIILDVGGMSCGGCAASVKRILESQPQVSTASVNLATETAIVWPVSEAKVVPNWQKCIGETLAKHLTSCGFKSNLRGQGAIEGDIPS